MVTVDLRDPNLIDNVVAVRELQESGLYSDDEIKGLYKDQLEIDMARRALHDA